MKGLICIAASVFSAVAAFVLSSSSAPIPAERQYAFKGVIHSPLDDGRLEAADAIQGTYVFDDSVRPAFALRRYSVTVGEFVISGEKGSIGVGNNVARDEYGGGDH